MCRSLIALLTIALLAFPNVSRAQAPPISDPQAIALAAKAIAVLTGGAVISDVTLIGDVTWVGESGSQKGAITLMAKGTGESRIDSNRVSETFTEIRNGTMGLPQGAFVVNAGDQQPWALHNCWTDAGWYFPAVSVLAVSSDPTVILSYIGQEKRNDVLVEHIQSFRYVASKDTAATLLTETLSTQDIYLDAATLLPVAITFKIHPDNDATSNIASEVDFLSYATFSGIQVPTRIQRFMYDGLILDIAVTSATFDSGLSDQLFAITGSKNDE